MEGMRNVPISLNGCQPVWCCHVEQLLLLLEPWRPHGVSENCLCSSSWLPLFYLRNTWAGLVPPPLMYTGVPFSTTPSLARLRWTLDDGLAIIKRPFEVEHWLRSTWSLSVRLFLLYRGSWTCVHVFSFALCAKLPIRIRKMSLIHRKSPHL